MSNEKASDPIHIRRSRHEEWRHLGDLLRHPELLHVDDGSDDERDPGLTRRAFVRRMAASMGLAGLSACTRAPVQEILPYADQPAGVTPGNPRYYATSLVLGGYATGLLVESHEGRPTKIEGNPAHPDSLGGTFPWEQALVLGLYDPWRANEVLRGGLPSTWDAFAREFASPGASGEGLHFVLEPTSSPLLVALIGRVRARLPMAKFHFWSPLAREGGWQGARLAFGRPLEAQIDLAAARVVLAIDGDFLDARPGRLRYARAFADGRRMAGADSSMNRLYVAESGVSVTGASADHRLALRDADLPGLAAAVASEIVGRTGAAGRAFTSRPPDSPHARWVAEVARDLLAHRGASLVIVGDAMPPEVHALGHFMNAALGNLETVVTFTDPPIFEAGLPSHDLGLLLAALDAGQVDTLIMLGENPVYTADADARFAERARKAKRTAYLGRYVNETAAIADWFVPEAHDLESWGDARSVDGTVSFVQPLVRPLFEGRTVSELLGVFAGLFDKNARALLIEHWRRVRTDFDGFWPRSLAKGVASGTAFARVAAVAHWAGFEAVLARASAPALDGVEVRFRPDQRVYDGRFTNNAWLLELPEPVHALTWDNAALMSPASAARLGVSSEEVVRVRFEGRALDVPVLIQAEHADESVTIHLGWGRTGREELARGVGANAYALRTSKARYTAGPVAIERLERRHSFAHAQNEFLLHGRDEDVYFHALLADYRGRPGLTKHKNEEPLELYNLTPAAPRQWGMVVDLTTCIGCSACVVACQAENNVPVVGKAGVAKGRRMHWLRVDRYFVDTPAGRHIAPQPMLCQHCEKAPCEYVCPVNATVHSADGLNQMVYNRCVGTRFCSNNCPYKVRRFNWFNYNADTTALERLQRNPDVTPRDRGVMEKCSYCVQRIREAEIRSTVEGRALGDGEIKTACQQACPAGAIVFGNIADAGSEVSRLMRVDRLYEVLHDLGTRPRTRYLAKIVNANPDLA